MKTFSISAAIVLAMIVGLITPMSLKTLPTTHLTKGAPKTYWSGSYPANSGYYSYGWYVFNASAYSDYSNITLTYQAQNVPNRFYFTDNCGLGQWVYSNSSYNNWVGSASYSGPWNFSGGISVTPSGNLILQKQPGCNSYKFQVETSTGSSDSDAWSVQQ